MQRRHASYSKVATTLNPNLNPKPNLNPQCNLNPRPKPNRGAIARTSSVHDHHASYILHTSSIHPPYILPSDWLHHASSSNIQSPHSLTTNTTYARPTHSVTQASYPPPQKSPPPQQQAKPAPHTPTGDIALSRSPLPPRLRYPEEGQEGEEGGERREGGGGTKVARSGLAILCRDLLSPMVTISREVFSLSRARALSLFLSFSPLSLSLSLSLSLAMCLSIYPSFIGAQRLRLHQIKAN
jgi:hypothetical protein